MEDISRHKADKEANGSLTEVYDALTGEFKSVKWADVGVGDVMRMHSRDFIPADCVILSVAEKNDECRGTLHDY
jgi:magnesium-transporting ATPase (P-type)